MATQPSLSLRSAPAGRRPHVVALATGNSTRPGNVHREARREGSKVPQPRRLAQARRGTAAAHHKPSAHPAGAPGSMAPAAAAAEAQVAVITTLGCPYCKKAKAALQAAGIPYAEYELSEQVEVLNKVKALTGQATVPQIFVGGKLLGGASDVIPMLDSGTLQQQLASTQAPALPGELRAVLDQAAEAAAAAAGKAGGAELAALRQLAAELRSAGLAGTPRGAFTLQRAAQWLQQSKELSVEAAAAALGQLQAAQLLTVADSAAAPTQQQQPLGPQLLQASPQLQLQLVADLPQPTKWNEPLNGQFAWFGPARPAAEVAEALRLAMLRLYDKHLVKGGKKVDYRALRADPAFADFVTATAELQKVDLAGLSSREQRMAFFINVYNALVVHALVVFGAADGSLSRLRWFDSISYLIGGRRFSSNDIEHGVLRGNSPSPASLFALLGKPQWAGKTFKAGDPRAGLAVQPVDPRIHFALNCGAASCPPIRVYTPDRLEFGLAAAATAFCESEVTVDKQAGELEMSMILKWYGGDFGTKQQLLEFLLQYLPPGQQSDLRELMAQRSVEEISFKFRPYDWTTNAVE